MSLLRTKGLQIGQDGTATNNFTLYQPGVPDGTLRIGNGNSGSVTEVAKIDNTGFKFTNSIQIGTDSTSTNNFTIYQPATPDGTLRIGVGNADNPTEVGRFDSNGYVPNKAPTFSGYNNGTQSVSASTDTKIVFDHENFDTNSNYDNATNYRFTPTVAGYYQFNTNVYVANFAGSWMRLYMMKNGSANTEFDRTITAGQTTLNGSCILYANGTTDYFEVYIKCQGGTTVQVGANDANLMTFNGTLVRAV